ncbi:MAG: hypothetical protein K1X51_13675 [Rhodospirillaceae bacterium]|nr:hypothetical protein [Rhodospirillaceae bacterium]
MFVDSAFGPRVPAEVRLELAAAQPDLIRQLRQIVLTIGTPGGETAWIDERLARHADGDILIFTARVGRLLVGFMMLEKSTMTASYSWVTPRFRGRGLGQRFYSFACINLGAPTPCFVFPREMAGEYAVALGNLPIETANDEGFCAIHPSSAVNAA